MFCGPAIFCPILGYGAAQFFGFAVAGSTPMGFSNGNLTASYVGHTGTWAYGRISDPTGAQVYTVTDSRYFEVQMTGGPANYCGLAVGFIDNSATYNPSNNPFGNPTYMGSSCNQAGLSPGSLLNGAFTAGAAFAASDTDALGVGIVGTTGLVSFYRNGVFIGSMTLPSQNFTAFITTHDNGSGQAPVFNLRVGADIQFLPGGFKAWNLR